MMRQNPIIYYCKKCLSFLLSIFLLTAAVFFLSRLTPVDPLQAYYGRRTEKMSAAEKELARERLGLNDPIPVQYIRWAGHALRGDFGISYKYKQDVMQVISRRAGNTLLLGGCGFLLIFAGALGLGLFCARFEDRWPDRILCRLGTLTSCIPEFWLSIMLILVFSVTLGWLPSSGAYCVGNASDPADRVRHLILPLTAVLSGHLWYYAYMVRNRLLEETRKDYVLLCRAKGLSGWQTLSRHCLPNVLPSFLALTAVSAPHILGGTYVVETVFSYPGLGTLSYESARYGDYNLLMVLCLLTGVTVIFCSMAGRMISEQIDPRIRAKDGRTQEVHMP